MSQGPSNPAPPVKIVTSPSPATIVFDTSGSSQSTNALSTTKIITPPAPTADPSGKLAPSANVHGALANSAGVSILFSSDGR
jgi:hypothetical protein